MKTLRKIMIADEHIKEMNYHNAELYCKLIDIEGYNDWRIPTFNELKSYVPDAFLDYRWFWTLDDYISNDAVVYHEHFSGQEVNKDIDKMVYILPVRSIKT